MGPMRTAIILLILATASPAAAQSTQFQIDDLRIQQEAAQRRAIDQDNQFQALDARLRADRQPQLIRRR